MQIIIGSILLIIGIVIRIIAILKLNKRFSFALNYQSSIETGGIYKYVRHPSYLGSLIMIVGSSLICPVFGVVMISIAFFIQRITVEEQILSRNKDYLKYKEKTGMLFPKIRR